jgi:DNA-binding beta-propeller fold protein YncE
MLRVTPDGRSVWVQSFGANTNTVLDAGSLAVRRVEPVGTDPETCAFQPGGPYGLIAHLNAEFLQVLETETGAPVTRIPLGTKQGSISFTLDGAWAFVALNAAAQVAVIDMAALRVIERFPVTEAPLGLVLLDPLTGPPALP